MTLRLPYLEKGEKLDLDVVQRGIQALRATPGRGSAGFVDTASISRVTLYEHQFAPLRGQCSTQVEICHRTIHLRTGLRHVWQEMPEISH